jgi:nitroreductase
MPSLPPAQLVEALHWRYATQKFDPTKKISGVSWKALEEALVLTPSSIGLQPWKFFVVTDNALKERLNRRRGISRR